MQCIIVVKEKYLYFTLVHQALSNFHIYFLFARISSEHLMNASSFEKYLKNYFPFHGHVTYSDSQISGGFDKT